VATLLAPDLASHPTLSRLSWGCGEDPMTKSVWYTAAEPELHLVLVLLAPGSTSWLGAPHAWSWSVYDRADARQPGPAAEGAADGCPTAAVALAQLADAVAVIAARGARVPAAA
jgi:hypothetical protein